MCVTAEEEHLTLYIVISYNSELFRKRMMRHEVRMGIDFVLR
jgi:hypothetical protein